MKVLVLCNDINARFVLEQIESGILSFGTNKAAQHSGKDFKPAFEVITNWPEFKKRKFIDDKPDFVFIVPELGWLKQGFNEGYSIAIDLIVHKLQGHFFYLKFLSIAEPSTILKYVDVKYRNIIQAFPHVCFLESSEIKYLYETYSSTHFELIKSLAISESGRLNVVEHELGSIKYNLEKFPDDGDINEVKSKLEKQLEEVSVLQLYASEGINKLHSGLNKAKRKSELKKWMNSLQEGIDEIKASQTLFETDSANTTGKSNYKVLIIEDEYEYRKFLSEVFFNLYNKVYPFSHDELLNFEIRDVLELVRHKAMDYEIFILDLLYKDKNGHWLGFNGLDLYKVIRENNPYACVRIITGLPRDAVSKIIAHLLNNDEIKISHLFTKRNGQDALKFNIIDRSVEINLECAEKEKRRKIFKPIPIVGIFDHPGVSNKVLNLLEAGKDGLDEYYDIAKDLFALYKEGRLERDTIAWDAGKLPSPKMKDKTSDSFFLKRLAIILTHRLMVIDSALRNDDGIVFKEDYELRVLLKVTNSSSFDKGYVTTKLGFNAIPKQDRDNEVIGFRIEYKNLFPFEIELISKHLRVKDGKEVALYEKLLPLWEWFADILLKNVTYETWDTLNLNYNPYINISEIEKRGNVLKKDISRDITNFQLAEFIQALINLSTDEFVSQILDFATDTFSINENQVKIPKEIKFKLDQIFQ